METRRAVLKSLSWEMKWLIGRQKKWFQRQLDERALPRYCTFTSTTRTCPLCASAFRAGHMVVKAYLTDSKEVAPSWVHVKCAQFLISYVGHDDVLAWRKQ